MNKQLLESVLNINRSVTALRRQVHKPQDWARRRRLLASVALTLCLGTSGLAIINDTFHDVPVSAFYHDAVNAIYRAGITAGCGTELFCPDQAVTRAQTAVFLQRGLSRVAYNAKPVFQQLERYNGKDVAVVTINTGGAPGQTGFVKLNGAVTWAAGTQGCPCAVGFFITQDGGGNSSGQFASAPYGYGNGATTWVVAVPTGTMQTFRLKMNMSGSQDFVVLGRGELSAIYAPFGSMGTNTLAAQPADEQSPATPSDHRSELLAPELPMRRKDH